MDFRNYRRDHEGLEEMVRTRMASLSVTDDDQTAIRSMLAPLDAKREPGHFHYEHSLRVGLLASEIAFELSSPSLRIAERKAEARPLLFAGLLHDVGKALVPACTLSATTHWTSEDQLAMEQHVTDGFRLLRDRFDFTAHVIVWHHKFQRGGYPVELPAPLQPFSDTTLEKARDHGVILMVADVFDAMHKKNTGSGGRFLTDQEIKEKMLALHPELLKGMVPKLYERGVLR